MIEKLTRKAKIMAPGTQVRFSLYAVLSALVLLGFLCYQSLSADQKEKK